MIPSLKKTSRQNTSIRVNAVMALVAIAIATPLNMAHANSNNSGRYVVPDGQGVWQAVESGEPGQGGAFYPSWYFGLDVSKSKWESDDFESTSTGAGLLVGNHFRPHLRWELRHSYQNLDSEFTNDEGESYTLSTLSLDYLVNKPKDGFSPILRAGVGFADGLEEDQGDAEALLGLGVQWREDRWTVRLMAEQMGQDFSWVGLTLAGYIGGNEQKDREKYLKPVAMVEQQSAVAAQPVKLEKAPQVSERTVASVTSPAVEEAAAPTANQSQQCGRIFSERVLEDIEYVSANSELMTEASKVQLTQIGKAYARRSYINVDAYVTAKTEFLAEQRADSIVSTLNVFGVLGDRISSEVAAGADRVSLSMKDTRGCSY